MAGFGDYRVRFLGSLAGLLVAFAQPAFADAPPSLRFLEQRLAALATENPGEYGIGALDMQTGEMVTFNGDQPFPMASTMKVAVAATLLSQVDAGQRRLDDPIGGTTAYRLLEAMLIHSNNQATDMLIASLGGPGVVDAWLRSHRLSGIRVDRNIAQLLSDRRDLRDIRDSSTPTAMLNLLRLIDTGNALSPASRTLLLDVMRRCATGSNRIRGLLPPGAMVEHKTGTLTGYTGDVGFLTRPDGRRLAVVFFARGGSDRPAVISTAARAIYDGFGNEGLAGQFGGRFIQASSRQAPAGLGLQSRPSASSSVPSTATSSACSLAGSAFQALC